MESPIPRPLAYLLATAIQNEAFESITGGSGPFGVTTNQTLRATGDSASGPEVNYDVTFDY